MENDAIRKWNLKASRCSTFISNKIDVRISQKIQRKLQCIDRGNNASREYNNYKSTCTLLLPIGHPDEETQ
jgi:hypothetical protein